MPSKYDNKLFRMDLLQEIEWYNEKTHRMKVKLTPNPERYDWKIINGKKVLCDKFEDIQIPEDVYSKIMSDMKGKGLYYVKPTITSNLEYIQNRIPKIQQFLECDESDYESIDKSEDFLNSLTIKEMTFVILCIDLKGSTKLSQYLSLEENSKIIKLFAKEMANIIASYHGYVLKYMGDGLIAYFPEPNFLGMEDTAVDCAASMKFLIENGINKVLSEKNLPELKFRIGLDTGEAIISTIGDISSKQQKDLIGMTVNFAAKIQNVAEENQIVIGDSTKKQMHTTRKKLFQSYSPSNWDYKIGNNVYPLHSLIPVVPY